MLILAMAAILNYVAEGRVYCQDSHATQFFYLGFSCPVNCNNVLEAVKRLKLIDEHNAKEGLSDKMPLRGTDTKTKTFYLVCERIFQNKMATEEVQKELDKLHNASNCRLIIKERRNYVDTKRCFRKSYHQQFLNVFTNILNKHAHGMYKFTEDMTALILEKVLGDNEVLRHDQDSMNVRKLLQFLKKALKKHKNVAHADYITLKSQHCLMMHVPGCFCRTGFVEHSGQCVQPSDCITDEEYTQYISRVHII